MTDSGSCFLICSDNLLIGAFRPLISKIITDIVGLIFIIYVTVFYLSSFPWSLFFLFHYLSAFCGFEHFMIPFSFLFLGYQLLLFNFFSGCPRVCNIHLWLIQNHYQETLYQSSCRGAVVNESD